jgi:transposase-like protein
MTTNRRHTEEFKLSVVRDMITRQQSVSEAAAERHISMSAIRRWHKQLSARAKREPESKSMTQPPTAAPNRRKYSLDTRAEMLQRIADGASLMDLQRETGIGNSNLSMWRKHAIANGTMPSPSNGAQVDGNSGHSNGYSNGHGAKSARVAAPEMNMRDAITYLKSAEREINRKLINGAIRELSQEHLLTLLALKTLQGAM